MLKILLSLFIICCQTLGFAQTTEQINPKDPNYNVELNAILQTLSANTSSLSQSVATTTGYFPSGILNSANGGTGANLSAASQYTVPYFSALGVMGNIGIGTTGYYLTEGTPPTWVPPQSIPRTLIGTWQDNTGATCTGGGGTSVDSTIIDTATDWANKNIMIIASVEKEASDSFTSTLPNVSNTSATALAGMNFGASHNGFAIIGLTLPSNNYTNIFGNFSSTSGGLAIGTNSSGNLVMVSGCTTLGSPTTIYSQIAGEILRTI